MVRRFMCAGGIAVMFAATPAPLAAHHAFAAEFDSRQPILFNATVTKMDWISPHVWIHVDVVKPDGTTEKWMAEGGAPTVLFRRGFTKASLAPGTKVVVDGYRARDGSRKMNARAITLPDGRKLFPSGDQNR